MPLFFRGFEFVRNFNFLAPPKCRAAFGGQKEEEIYPSQLFYVVPIFNQALRASACGISSVALNTNSTQGSLYAHYVH